MKSFALVATVLGLLALVLTACARPTAGSAVSVPTATVTASPSVTVVVPPPATVYAAPPATVTVPAVPAQTPCQWLHANNYSYEQAYAAWAQEGYPINWDADRDGYPCEQSYGNQN
jgi:hypothetical protein